jgi:hypothetical protein
MYKMIKPSLAELARIATLAKIAKLPTFPKMAMLARFECTKFCQTGKILARLPFAELPRKQPLFTPNTENFVPYDTPKLAWGFACFLKL